MLKTSTFPWHSIAIAAAALALLASAAGAEVIVNEAGWITVEAPRIVRHEAGKTEPSESDRVTLTHGVPYGDLDLAMHADVLELERRIAERAQVACEQLDALYPLGNLDMAACVRRALEGAGPGREAGRHSGSLIGTYGVPWSGRRVCAPPRVETPCALTHGSVFRETTKYGRRSLRSAGARPEAQCLPPATPNGARRAPGRPNRAALASSRLDAVHASRAARGAGLLRSRRERQRILYAVDVKGTQRLVTFLVKDCCHGRPELCGIDVASGRKRSREERAR